MSNYGHFILMTGLLAATAANAQDYLTGIPPVDWTGKLGVQYRETWEESADSYSQEVYTAELNGLGYVWEPWYGIWKSRLAASWEEQNGNADSNSAILSGAGELNLFHLSRFPFWASVEVKDSRVDFDDLFLAGRDERFTRYGISQSYRPQSGSANANISLYRDERDDLTNNVKEVSDRMIASSFTQLGAHRFNASLLAKQTSIDLSETETSDWQADLSHTYAPSPRFTTTTSLGSAAFDTSSGIDRIHAERNRLGNTFLWRSEAMPISLQGDAALTTLQQDALLSADRDEQLLRGTLFMYYQPTDRWRWGLGVGGRRRSGDVEEQNLFETLTLDYASRPIPLGVYTYSYGGGVDLRNESNTPNEDERIYRTDLTHNLMRTWMHDWGRPVAATLTLGQDLILEESNLQGDLGTLVNRLSYGLNSSGEGYVSSIYLVLYDARNTGRNDLVTQNLSLSGVHNMRLSRYESFNLNFNLSLSNQSGQVFPVEDDFNADLEFDFVDDPSSRSEYSSLEAVYQHDRPYGVHNLRFLSRLRGSSGIYRTDNPGDTRTTEVLWENRIDYLIGKLEIDFRTLWIERPEFEEGSTKSVVLSINRYF